MPEQFSLPGFDPAPKPRRPTPSRPQRMLFFAILPPIAALPDIEQRSHALLVQHGLTGKPIRADRKHVTLTSLGGYDEALPQQFVDATCAVAATVAMPRFEVVFDKALTFRDGRAFVLIGDEAEAQVSKFRKALSQALAQAGLRNTVTSTAHMTLAYDKRHVPEHYIEPIRFAAEEFVLVESLVGQTVHRHLGRWPLRT
jgi:RNA 2',3'-cyclic 3'-phosphodiesterase